VACRHCRARFEARDPNAAPYQEHADLSLLTRVNELISSVDADRTDESPVEDWCLPESF